MKKMKSFPLIAFSLLFVLLISVGCNAENVNEPENDPQNKQNNASQQDNENQALEADDEPEEVTLKFLFEQGEDQFNLDFKEPIENEFSHITLEFVDSTDLDETFAEGILPDIYFVQNPIFLLSKWEEYELTMDLEELIEKHGFDLSRIEPSLIDEHRAFSEGNLYTLPIDRGMSVLHYNKYIFDIFGVDYPEDNMTWSEVIELARDVTGEKDGVQYYGLQPGYPQIMLEQMGTPFADPETGEPTFTSEEYGPEIRKNLQILEEIFSIHGNIPEDDPASFVYDQGNQFVTEQNVAMLPLWQLIPWYSGSEDFDFDIATIPVMDDLPGVSRASRAFSLGVASTSEHPNEAFKVIEFMLSDDMQKKRAAELGYGSVLKDPTINEHLFEDLVEQRPWIENLNFEALTMHPPATTSEIFHPYEQIVAEAYPPMIEKFIEGKSDINTIIREAQEEAEILIEEEQKRE